MSDKKQTEQELWDVLTEPVVTHDDPDPVKKPRPKSGPRFASEAPVKDVPAAPNRRVDGFFLTCMAGVAAVSVAATLIIGGMLGSSPESRKAPGPTGNGPLTVSTAPADASPDSVQALEQENEQLREQVQLQKQQIIGLQAQILDLTGDASQIPTTPGEIDPQVEAYDIFHQIRDAYADFDRETLDKLIPEMDKRLTYLSSDALSEYYLILEYVEMPSNG